MRPDINFILETLNLDINARSRSLPFRRGSNCGARGWLKTRTTFRNDIEAAALRKILCSKKYCVQVSGYLLQEFFWSNKPMQQLQMIQV
jgi:hypothetical protein